MQILDLLLAKFCINPSGPRRPAATDLYTFSNALSFARKAIPNFDALVRNRRVLDYGFGWGYQAIAMVQQCGSRHVDGIDVVDEYLERARKLATNHGENKVAFYLSDEYFRRFPDRKHHYDVIVSLGCFEHYSEPERELARMVSLVRPGGLIVIAFAEPWFSHCGGHSYEWCVLPWAHLLFPCSVFLRAHHRYYPWSRARTFQELGLNRMSVSRFEKIFARSGCSVEFRKRIATKNLPFVTGLPVVREFLTSSCTVVLRTRAAGLEATPSMVNQANA
jgi:cyclopropane fatty-acyl-phospholipid synthase-like methyltransferase